MDTIEETQGDVVEENDSGSRRLYPKDLFDMYLMSQYYQGMGSSGVQDTTSDGKQVFLCIGDSTSNGFVFAYAGQTSVANTCFSTTDGITITTLTDSPEFCIKYNALTGYKAVIVKKGVGSSTLYPNGNNNNWYTSGDNYAPAVTAARNALTTLGLNRLKGIIVQLGINDAVNSAQALSNVQIALTSLITRLTADFPNVPITWSQIGKNSGGASVDTRIAFVRNAIKQAAIDNSNINLCGAFASMFTQSGYYNADGIHLDQLGNGFLGDMVARWFYNSSYTKWARSIISSHFDELSTARKTLIQNFITAHETEYLNVDMWYNYKTTTKDNTFFDWAFLSGGLTDLGFSFSANSHIATNGSSTYFRAGYTPSLSSKASGQSDEFIEIKVKANSTPGSTTAYAWGSTNSGATIYNGLAQSASVLDYITNTLNSAVLTYNGETAIGVGSYFQYRNGGNEFLYKDGSQVATGATTSQTRPDGELFVGCLNQLPPGPGARFFINGQFERILLGKFSAINNISTFITDLNTLTNNW